MRENLKSTREGNRHKLELSVGGEAVARLNIVDAEMRLVNTWVRMGGLASVSTRPKHRGRGFGRLLMERTIEYMRQEGFLVSILFGIPGYYHRFGYATVMPRSSLARVKVSAAEALDGGLHIREAAPDDYDALVAIYNAENAGRNGPMKRSKEAFVQSDSGSEDWFQERKRILVAEVDGRPVGYALGEQEWQSESKWGEEAVEIAAPGVTAQTAGRSLVRGLASAAADERVETLTLEMLPDAPLAAVLREVGYRQEIAYSHNQGSMGRIIELGGLVAALTDTVIARLNEQAAGEQVGEIVFDCGGEQAKISCGRGRRLAVNLPQEALLQLLMGYCSTAELRLKWPGCVLEEDVAVVDALFPAGYPYMWRSDHF
jgi:predicted acetyltransferase